MNKSLDLGFPGAGGVRVKGRGEYVLFEAHGPDYQYMLVRDTYSTKWRVSFTYTNERSQMVLVYVGETDHLWQAEVMASEDAQERHYANSEIAVEEVLDALGIQ